MPSSVNPRYHRISILLHWAMLLLIAAVYAAMELRDLFPKGSEGRDAMKEWHFMLGLLVFALVWIRLLARLLFSRPAITPPPARWQQQFAKLGHLALYGLMIALPLLGWLLLSAGGKPIPFFGLSLPALIPADNTLKGSIKEWHEALATLGYFLIGLHALAAIYHHHVLKDNTLTNMLPGKRS